jgi:hypothetical protein
LPAVQHHVPPILLSRLRFSRQLGMFVELSGGRGTLKSFQGERNASMPPGILPRFQDAQMSRDRLTLN